MILEKLIKMVSYFSKLNQPRFIALGLGFVGMDDALSS
jgi:hypothetical protein